MAIRKVVLPGGKVDKEAGWGVPQRKRVIPDWVAAEVTRILEENMTSGTGIGAYFGKTSAGKTGTTDNYADAWFCGFTPRLEATIWIGYPQGEIPMTVRARNRRLGPDVPGDDLEARSWSRPSTTHPARRSFPTPKTTPEWSTHTLQYAMSGGYYSRARQRLLGAARRRRPSGNDDRRRLRPGP